jgi:hypothetical protein
MPEVRCVIRYLAASIDPIQQTSSGNLWSHVDPEPFRTDDLRCGCFEFDPYLAVQCNAIQCNAGVYIEKNGACPYMRCGGHAHTTNMDAVSAGVACGCEFCWVCMQIIEPGKGHQCNTFKKTPGGRDSESREKKRRTQEEELNYLSHYYERYEHHHGSRKHLLRRESSTVPQPEIVSIHATRTANFQLEQFRFKSSRFVPLNSFSTAIAGILSATGRRNDVITITSARTAHSPLGSTQTICSMPVSY